MVLKRRFQQYFSYIVVVSIIGGENQSTRIKHRPAANHWQTLSHNVVSNTKMLPSEMLYMYQTQTTRAIHQNFFFLVCVFVFNYWQFLDIRFFIYLICVYVCVSMRFSDVFIHIKIVSLKRYNLAKLLYQLSSQCLWNC